MLKLLRSKVIFPVLIVEFELGTFLFQQRQFSRVEPVEGLQAMSAVIIAAFIDGDLFTLLPAKECAMAIGTEELCINVFTESLLELKEVIADLAFKLRHFFAVIVVDVDMRSITEWTNNLNRNCRRAVPAFNRSKRLAVLGFE